MSRPHAAPHTSAPQQRMRHLSLKALYIAALSLGFTQSGFAENKYWNDFGNAPVYIQQVYNGAKQTLKFIDYKDDMLIAEIDLGDGGVGEMSLPVTESMVNSLRFDISVMTDAYKQISNEQYIQALNLLRPKVYPLIKFHQLPEMFTQLHVPIRTLIQALIGAKEFEEANDLINRITLSKSDIKYSQSAIDLMNAYLTNEDFEAAAKVAGSLPVKDDYAVNIRPLIDAADTLRGAGLYNAVIPLYQAIEPAVPEDVRKNIRMWLAYSLVLADRLDEATPIIDALAEPAPNDRLFSLYKLLYGSREHSQGNYNQALDLLTRGFVRAQTSYVWVPEMLYLIGDCYARSEDTLAARNVWTEISVLYPESPWAERANTSLAKLPAPKTADN
jgi:TolA-binding protein